MTSPARATVLVVDDDHEIRDIFARHLETDYEVRTAGSGSSALAALDGGAVDVVLLDRMMPEMSGEEVLARVREAGHDVPVVMVTAREPDLDILEMGFDEYVTKPVSRDDLLDVVESMRIRATYDETIREYFSLARKVSTLRRELDDEALADHAGFAEAEARLEVLEDEATAALDDAFSGGKMDELFYDLPTNERRHGADEL